MPNRRQFLASTGAAGLVTFSHQCPGLLTQVAHAAASSAASDRILVVIQLSGGNDGLNTIIPFNSDIYYRSRPSLALAKGAVDKLGDDVGLHPQLKPIRPLLDSGQLAVIQGVGYPEPNRSHFVSTDIWHTARQPDAQKTEKTPTGWIGRYLDAGGKQAGKVGAIHFGGEKQPLALSAVKTSSPSIRDLREFRLNGSNADVASLVQSSRSEGDLLSFVKSTADTAIVASEKLVSAAKSDDDRGYPDSDLASKLRDVASLIGANIGARVYYVTLDGFDTHSRQADAHANLLGRWAGALAAFQADIQKQGITDRVCTFTFSEFGRRVQENASLGTDHGTAAPVFVTAPQITNSLLGNVPNLTDLDQGDIKYDIDFRQVYRSLLEDWLAVDSKVILDDEFAKLKLFG